MVDVEGGLSEGSSIGVGGQLLGSHAGVLILSSGRS